MSQPIIEPSQVFVHLASTSRYGVTAVTGDGRIKYSRFGDGATFELSAEAFREKLRPATAKEVEDLLEVQTVLQTMKVPANAENIQNALDGKLSNVAPDPAGGDDDVESVLNARNPNPVGEMGLLYEPTENDTFERLILYPNVVDDVEAALRAVENFPLLEDRFAISKIQALASRCALNFYGEPGTGKTDLARAIARRRKQLIYQVVYSAIVSKYLGDTAKGISTAFQRAKEENAVLLFDEADALLSRRLPMGESCATSINQNRITLMQELDRFDGLVVFTTNHFGNYDPALLRRIAGHVEFKLPNPEMRTAIFDRHLPKKDYVRNVDWDMVSAACDSFSGGDIKNVVLNAIAACSSTGEPSTWFLEESHLLRASYAVREAKLAHMTGAEKGDSKTVLKALPKEVQAAVKRAVGEAKGKREAVRD